MLRCGLKTVINLQRPGEHASCGNALEQESGFTYRPETFMEAGSECQTLTLTNALNQTNMATLCDSIRDQNSTAVIPSLNHRLSHNNISTCLIRSFINDML